MNKNILTFRPDQKMIRVAVMLSASLINEGMLNVEMFNQVSYE